jgi:hypothetical protein
LEVSEAFSGVVDSVSDVLKELSIKFISSSSSEKNTDCTAIKIIITYDIYGLKYDGCIRFIVI